MFLLRPSRPTNDLFLYLLAVAAERYEIEVHAYCVLSNHFHCVVTDRHGRVPMFEQYLDGLVARSFNALLGRWESFWAPGSYSAVRLLTSADVLEKVAYVLHNPTAAGLVRRGTDWPGLRTAPERIGCEVLQIDRPSGFFREDGPLPSRARLPITCPPGVGSPDVFRGELVRLLGEMEERSAQQMAAGGRDFLGVRRVLSQKPLGRPAPVEPRRGLAPRVACRDKWKRIEALARLKQFLAEYRIAWSSFVDGNHETSFPAGTYWMRVCYGVTVAGSS